MKKNIYRFTTVIAAIVLLSLPVIMIKDTYASPYDALYKEFDYNGNGIVDLGVESQDMARRMKELYPDQKVYDRVSGTYTDQSLYDLPEYKKVLGEDYTTQSATDSETVIPATVQPEKKTSCDHDYIEKTTKEPTCTESGEKTYTCSKCKDSYTEEVSALGHDYTKEVSKEPTCTEQGTATYTCSRCGDSYEGTILSTGHKASSWEVSKEATCETPGEKVLKCSVCGEVMESETIPATEHIDRDWEVEKAPGLFSSGSRVVKCTKCGKITKTMDVPRLMPLSLPEFLLLCFSIVTVIGLLVGLVARILKRKKAAYN